MPLTVQGHAGYQLILHCDGRGLPDHEVLVLLLCSAALALFTHR